MMIDVGLLPGVATGEGVCGLVAAGKAGRSLSVWPDRVEVGEGVLLRVALGGGVGVDGVVTVGDGVEVTVGDAVSVSVSANAT